MTTPNALSLAAFTCRCAGSAGLSLQSIGAVNGVPFHQKAHGKLIGNASSSIDGDGDISPDNATTGRFTAEAITPLTNGGGFGGGLTCLFHQAANQSSQDITNRWVATQSQR